MDITAPLPRCALCGRRTGNTLYRANVDGKLEKVCSSCYCQLAFEDSDDADYVSSPSETSSPAGDAE